MIRKVSKCDPEKAPELLCDNLQPVIIEHKNPWFSVISRGGYYTLEYKCPQVVVLPIVNNQDIVMLRVWRPVIGDCPLEFPAGDSLPGETPRDAAVREFAEESGIEIVDKTRFIPELPISEMPGRIPVLLSVFSVQIREEEFNLRKQHDGEIRSVELISILEAARKIVSGEIYLSSTCALLSRLILKRFIDSQEKLGDLKHAAKL